MTSVDDIQQRLLDKELEIDRLEALVARRKNELEAEKSTIHELEVQMGTSNYPTLRELGQDVAPEDYLDMVNRLENRLKLQQMRSQAIQREVSECKLMNRQAEDNIQHLDVEAARIKAVTGFIEPHKQAKRRRYHICSVLTAAEQAALIRELTFLVSKIKCELKMGKEVVTHKDKVIAHLHGREVDFDELNEKMFQLCNKLNAQNNELVVVTEEYEKFRREHLRADRMISRLESRSDDGSINSLTADNMFLKRKITEHVEMRRTQDRAVKAQSFRLAHLQKRADMITNAVADLKMTELVSSKLKGTVQTVEEPICSLDIEAILPSDETVDVALYELLARDVEAINDSVALKDIIAQEKEATIDTLVEKVERVLYQNNEETQLKHEDNMNFDAEVIALNREVRAEREQYQQEIADLRKAKCRAQRRVSKASGKQRSLRKDRN
eukprot:TRINITY_DN32632_c0_g1_i1.p1 TRINITY_DN32632_c0_g1~~TRINITY_DN32632_c0_g1_i1.p1  ORF type:complete len:441 (+),score=208.73 TRINITY_DN32632_c0_g1_i1:215-1537(+)